MFQTQRFQVSATPLVCTMEGTGPDIDPLCTQFIYLLSPPLSPPPQLAILFPSWLNSAPLLDLTPAAGSLGTSASFPSPKFPQLRARLDASLCGSGPLVHISSAMPASKHHHHICPLTISLHGAALRYSQPSDPTGPALSDWLPASCGILSKSFILSFLIGKNRNDNLTYLRGLWWSFAEMMDVKSYMCSVNVCYFQLSLLLWIIVPEGRDHVWCQSVFPGALPIPWHTEKAL